MEKQITYEKNENGCWIVTSHKGDYPIVERVGKRTLIHRMYYELHKGAITPGLHIRHTCDNPRCINPDHLLEGTHADNMMDKVVRNRAPKGSSIPNAKLTEDQVFQIRNTIGYSIPELCHKFHVSASVISSIRSGRSWKHVPCLLSEEVKSLPPSIKRVRRLFNLQPKLL